MLALLHEFLQAWYHVIGPCTYNLTFFLFVFQGTGQAFDEESAGAQDSVTISKQGQASCGTGSTERPGGAQGSAASGKLTLERHQVHPGSKHHNLMQQQVNIVITTLVAHLPVSVALQHKRSMQYYDVKVTLYDILTFILPHT